MEISYYAIPMVNLKWEYIKDLTQSSFQEYMGMSSPLSIRYTYFIPELDIYIHKDSEYWDKLNPEIITIEMFQLLVLTGHLDE